MKNANVILEEAARWLLLLLFIFRGKILILRMLMWISRRQKYIKTSEQGIKKRMYQEYGNYLLKVTEILAFLCVRSKMKNRYDGEARKDCFFA